MKNISLALILAVQVVSLSSPSAEAEGFKIRKDSLEQVDWFHGKRQAQIVDDDMEVRDLRRRNAPAPYVEIQLEPTQGYTISGPAGTSPDSTIPAGGLRVGNGPGTTQGPSWKTTLPQSGFGQSYMPTRSLRVPGLAPGYNTGIHGQLIASPKTTTNPPTKLANRGDYIKPPLKSYPRYNSQRGVDGSTQFSYKGSVYGQIRRGSLINAN